MAASASRWIKLPSSPASEWPGSRLVRRRRQFVAATPFSTIRPGTRVRRALWENPPYLPSPTISLVLARSTTPGSGTPLNCGNRYSVSSTRPEQQLGADYDAPESTVVSGNSSVAKPQLQTGPRAAVQREYRAPVARQRRADGGICGFSQFTHSGRWPEPERRISGRLRQRCAGYTLGLRPRRSSIRAQVGCADLPIPADHRQQQRHGKAHYDSLQIKAETKSRRHGLYALLGYTYSRTFDSGMPDGLGTFPGATYFPLPGHQKLDWGLSQLNLNTSSRPA